MAVNDYFSKLHMEGLGLSNEHPGSCFYAYVTYNKDKLRGFKIEKLQKYSIQAWATIPVSENQLLDMRLFTDQGNRILDFTMQYRGPFNNVEHALSKSAQLEEQMDIYIRSDYRHGPHFDIQVVDNHGRKRFDIDVPQVEGFPNNYESAINAVFMQVEKLSDPLIGAKYWLSPTGIYPERVSVLSILRSRNNISTSLSVISRMINLKTYEESRKGPVDEVSFWRIVDLILQFGKEQEKRKGGPLDVEVPYSTDLSMLPFPFFLRDDAQHLIKAFDISGTEMEFEPVAAVYEQRGPDRLIRDITEDEKKFITQ